MFIKLRKCHYSVVTLTNLVLLSGYYETNWGMSTSHCSWRLWLEGVLRESEERQFSCGMQMPFMSVFRAALAANPMAGSTIPRHYLLSIRFWFLIFECCAGCWTNFSLFCLGCQFLTLDGRVNFPFLSQSRCSIFFQNFMAIIFEGFRKV